jgi:antitoxin component YwqK of YwqJK toxin-antitoxin module
MKANGKYNNGQIISEQKGDILTYYHASGKIKAQGKYINSLFQGKWIFNKKEGYLWVVGNFKDNKKHGKWTRFKSDGSIEKEENFDSGKKVK